MPLGREVVRMESWPKTVMENDALATGEKPSEACTVKENFPDALGLPVSRPFDPSPRPCGSDTALQEYGPPFPPLAARIAEYPAPMMPFGRLEVVMVSGLRTVKLRVTGSAAWKPRLPFWVAVSEQMPAAKTDTRLSVTEQTDGVAEETATGNPEVAVARIAKGGVPEATFPSEFNEMVCGAGGGGAGAVILKVREA